MKQSLSAIISVLAITMLALTSVAGAAGNGNGMRVSPVRTDLTIKPGNYKTVTLFVQNVTGEKENLQVIVNDFVANSDESGAPALLLNGQTNDQHGLKKYITAPEQVAVAAGQQKEVKVTVSIPKSLPGGGYYGSVRFAPTVNGGTSNVSLAGSVGSLILVRVPGNVTEKMTLASFDVRQDDSSKVVFTSNKNITAVARFRNEGDVQEQPFGKVIVMKGGKEISNTQINDYTPPSNVLPDSIRKFNIPLKKISSFGKYTAVANFGYGSNGQLLSASTTFYVIPVWMILLIVILVLVILFLIFVFPKMLRNYNRNVVRKASRRR